MTEAVENDSIEQVFEKSAHPPAWRNPRPAGRYDLVVVGAGPAGLMAARETAALGAKVALIERDFIGGHRLNVGCVQSKAIIRTARLYAEMRDASSLGGQAPQDFGVDFAMVIARIRRIQTRLSRADSAELLVEAGIDVFFGPARFLGVDTIGVGDDVLRFGKALIATGSRPLIPPVLGLVENGYLTNENVFDLRQCPARLLVVGGGPVGCEVAQAFCRLGAHVIIAQDNPMFLPREERDAARILSDALVRDGVETYLNTAMVAVHSDGTGKIVDLVCDGFKFSLAVDAILVGTGRIPNVEGLGLAAAGVRFDAALGVQVDDFLQTSNKRIYAAGDVCLEHKFAHAAVASARIAIGNALFRGQKRLSDLTIPWCTYTDPEIAHVGLYVREAREIGIAVRTFTILMHDVDRAVTEGDEDGFVKIHVKQGTDRILGATIVARHAGEMINGVSLAINSGIGLRALAQVIHTYPTQAEAIKMAADAYNRARWTPAVKALAKQRLARA